MITTTTIITRGLFRDHLIRRDHDPHEVAEKWAAMQQERWTGRGYVVTVYRQPHLQRIDVIAERPARVRWMKFFRLR